jgi:hypothetical protein
MIADESGCPRKSTGGYYWFPIPSHGSVTWAVLTCYALDCDAQAGHFDLWPSAIARLAEVWHKDARAFGRHLKDRYTALPRGDPESGS